MKETLIIIGAVSAILIVAIVGVHLLSEEPPESAPTPDAETAAAIQELHDYQAEVEKYQTNCKDLEKIAKDCSATLRECVDTLQSNYLLPKSKEP